MNCEEAGFLGIAGIIIVLASVVWYWVGYYVGRHRSKAKAFLPKDQYKEGTLVIHDTEGTGQAYRITRKEQP